MGTWSAQPFGNDTALDWEFTLEESGFNQIETAFDVVLEEQYVEADAACEGVAALATLAVALDPEDKVGGDWVSETVSNWARKNADNIPDSLLDKGLEAASRIMSSNCELYELWDEAGELNQWLDYVGLLVEAIKR